MEPQVGFWICGWYLSFLLLSLVRQTTSGDCKGQRIGLHSAPGYVSDGPGNYSVNGNCEWLIEAPNDNYRILLNFLFMETECAYDYLFVYDGDSYSDRLLASLSGSSLPSTLEATSGKMLLHLFSDANYNLLGFNATYSFSLCPQGCSGHGLCQENSQCLCDLGWSGEGCQVPSCRSYAQHGICNQENQRAVCSTGYMGERCDLSLTDNQGAGNWYNVSSLDPIFTPRAAAAGAFLPPTNSLYIFGGSDLNSPLGDLLIYNFTSNTWERKMYPGRPAARHSHIVVEWNGTLILFGGELAGGNLTGDTWVFLPLEERWMELTHYSTLHPPPVANHAAATVDNWLYVFGGRTSQDVFSSQMFRLNLMSWEWEVVLPGGGKPPAAAGHSMVFHAASRTLLIFGGHRPSTARFSVRVNTTDLFHVDLNYWTTLRPRDGNRGPRERAFHSATVIGNYMVIYGGNLHIHHHEEKCYDEEIFFYHLGCHQWVPSKIMSQIVSHYQGKQAMGGGRYSHVAALMKGRVLLIAGGYSGFPRDDLLAFKVPVSVYQTAVQDYHLDYCHMYTDEITCSKDPECTWCQTSCQTPQPYKNCSDKSCLGLARLLSDCQSCLAFSTNMTSSSHIKRSFGWCVQNETCMPISERSSCSVGQISGMHGWWGPATTFITTLDGCRTHNFLPGLHLITYHHPRNESQPDGVSLVRNTKISMTPSTEMDVSLVYKGFLYPMLSPGSSPERVSIWVRIQRFFVIARLGRAPGSLSSLEEVGRWSAHQEKEERRLQRNSGEQLFPNAERGSRYAVQIEGYLNNTGNGHASELSMMWDRTGVPGGSEISFLFLEPHRSDNCSGYPSCLACLADQGCGWCPQIFKCYQRLAGEGAETCKDNPLILSPSSCQLCEEYRECEPCAKDPYCEWQTHSSKKGDSLCSRRGRVRNSIRTTEACPKACNQRRSCSECLSNSSHCAWCQSTGKCFYFAAYLAKYAYGECRDWYDSVHSAPQCTDCSGFTTCRECLKSFECGWCGNSDNPTVGRCYSGDFSGLRGYSNCSQALSLTGLTAPAEPAQWSYSSCPDVDECRLEMATCHQHATCRNTPESYECHCNRGYSGDGVTHCNQTCYNECSHGTCSGPPSYTCVCDLGWTSDYAAVNESGVECSVDCGCHFHSTCKHGRGKCDSCQDWTQGEYCQECQPGSFGSAIQKPGCQECMCNKHGTADLGFCDRETGLCYCSDNTQGDRCEKCATGYYGDPRSGGICYLECQGRQFIPSVSSSALGSPSGSYCLWVLSVSENAKPCHPDVNCPRLTLTLQPDIRVNCTHSYVYMFDGIPGFLDTGLLQSDRSLLGAFCGQGRGAAPITVEATTGVLVVYYEANNTEPAGFNATYKVHLCYPPCGPNQVCQGHRCVCRNPLSGPSCQRVVCPKNCSAEDGQGVCNQTLGFCLCYPGYAGEDCSLPLAGKIVWENLIDPQLTADTASRFLHRLGHTMVEGPDNTMWMFGGLSLRDGVLGSVYRYAISERRWTQMLAGTEGGGPGPSSRYFHAAAYNSLRNAMYVVGGLTARGASNDFWVLNLTTLQWRLESAPLVPPVAGHTLTSRRGSSLLLIGGYSPENGFNNRVLEYSIELETWKVGHQTGTPPTGLYAHSTVYHEGTDAFYVFGGQRFHVEAVMASAELYSLYYPNLTWSLLAPSQGRKPLSHFFHVAAILRDTMIVVGGRTEQQEYSNHILFYQIHCNSWIRPNRSDMVLGVPMNKSIGHTVAVVGSRLYISGGFNGVALGRMVTLTVPSDPCLLFSTNVTCSQSLGSCVWCQHSCVSADTANRSGCPLPITSCYPLPRSADDCRRLKTCSECLAQHPRSMSAQLSMGSPRCKWCTNCPEGACIGNDGSCTSENDCRINQREIFLASNCSEISCEASDCHKCTASGKCMWTRQFKRTGETRRILSVQPTYDWTCFSHSLLNVSPMPVESSPPLPCPTPCHNHSMCHDCLSSKGADGGWQQCVWSVALSQCMSPTFLPMRCAAGACGRVLSGTESCSPSCSRHTHCAACIQHPRCGWCARREGNGEGECMQGGLSGPTQGEQCFSDDSDWAFMSCPPENECLNQHHDCNETQNCSDLPNGFKCTCKKGYTLHNVTGLCRPVCDHGCVNGTCVEPNRCRCDFGYVGENCSVACPCNKHSNCLGLGAEDKCEECRNNTMGTHCEKCKPLFVGSAINGGTCRSCFDFCRGNSEVCLRREEHEMALREPETYLLDPRSVSAWVSQGPTEDTAVCVNCQNNSCGEKCDQCLPGYFLLDKRCTKCQCNGHADTCSEIDGTNCPCSNNTETGNCQNSPQSEKKDCYKYQCAKCKDSFHGNPVNGRQCYRLMTVEQEYCFDPTSQSNCFHEPNIQNLPLGRTVFFGVQPKFTNVDIRVTVDVTFGCVDVFVSTSYETFSVEVDPLTGVHGVRVHHSQSDLEGHIGPEPLTAAANGSLGRAVGKVNWLREERPHGLITYITVGNQQTVLIVRGVKDRVVITYPHELHTLKSSRFYLLLLGNSSNGSGESQGLLFFRQDQAHIDLFVFFSVFFSCFFLFLSACVLLWKVKQWLDVRREQRRHLQEMSKMASRPFAKLTVYFQPDVEPLSGCHSGGPILPSLPHHHHHHHHHHHRSKPRVKSYDPSAPQPPSLRHSDPFLSQLLGYTYCNFRVGPITLEPTDDGMAGVVTLLLQLPGGTQAPNRACLGSALVTLRHNLQEYCGPSHVVSSSRKGLLSHENLTSMSL